MNSGLVKINVNNMNIPDNIKKLIESKKFTVDDVGMSQSNVVFYDDMILKTNIEQGEVNMMKWLDGKLPVPKVIAYENNCLLMSKINGKMLCDDKYMTNPNLLISLLVEALNMFWGVDTHCCPCDYSLEIRLKIAEYRVENNLCDIADAEPETYGKNGFANPQKLLKWLIDNKPKENNICLSHGDFCLPNIFAVNDKINGFIDLGKCGLADKYQDLALCYRSLKHNADGRFTGRVIPNFNAENLFIELGIIPDRELINYYILLDELF